MKTLPLIVAASICLYACGNSSNEQKAGEPSINDSQSAPVETALSLVRENVQTNAVASYSKKVPNDLNDWHFNVNVFETKDRFVFNVKFQYEEIEGSDNITIPNLGIEPKVELRAGPEPYSCIIGFLDKDGTFKEYKKVYVVNDALKMTTLKQYTVTVVNQ
ncbi:MAG TPA: hypothetical protein VLC98_01060 [Phnomibacter sp.]|nr:hypothetical protein [Phnomibacter sp.]